MTIIHIFIIMVMVFSIVCGGCCLRWSDALSCYNPLILFTASRKGPRTLSYYIRYTYVHMDAHTKAQRHKPPASAFWDKAN